MKYIYHIAQNKVICLTQYAGKPVRAVAKCHEDYDEFNAETGMELAKRRCDLKVAKKRFKNINRKLCEATDTLVEMQKNVESLSELVVRYMNEVEEAENQLNELEEKLCK